MAKRRQKKSMRLVKEHITPKKAAEYLKKNTCNRPFKPSVAANYAGAMTAGEWVLNGDTIRFNSEGDLIDGQHRLQACVLSGRSFDTFVIRDLPAAAYDTIDQGNKRTLGDVLARHGKTRYTVLAAAVRLMYRYESERGYTATKGAVRIGVAMETLHKHPGLEAAVAWVAQVCPRNNLIMHESSFVFLYYMTSLIDPADAAEFWGQVATGEGLTKTKPAYVLRERFITNQRMKASKLTGDATIALAIKGWNAFRDGKPCKFLVYNPVKEEFPRAR